MFLMLSHSKISTQTSIKTSIEVVNALETFASIVTVVPIGIAFPKETLLTEDVTTICSEWRLAEILAALSILANSSPPNKLFNAFVSPGKTESVSIVSESLGVLITSIFSFLSKAKR